MKTIHKIAALIVLVCISTVALAAQPTLPAGMTAVPLATITNDRDTSISRLKLVLNDQGTVRGIYLQTSSDAGSDDTESTGRLYWLDGIESADGVVLGQGQGHKAILLRGSIQANGNHGSLQVSYLSNGLFGHYDSCRINLHRSVEGPANWQLVNAYDGHRIQHIRVKTWTLGIATLTNVCPT